MTRLALPAAVLLATLAAWLSQGTLAVASGDGPRIALLPLSASALLLVVLAGLAVVAIARARLALVPVALLVLVVLPWVPLPMPAAILVWAGSIRWLIWFGVALLVLAPFAPRVVHAARPTALGELFVTRPRFCAGVLALAICGWSAWQVAPSIPGGDEPHYLVITQSLLRDHDLAIENNHLRGDYQAYYPGALAPHYIRRGRDGQIYSIHAPGLPALVAPAFAIGGYHGVVLFLLLLSAAGSALAWHVAWLVTRQTSAAWFGWAAVTLAATTIFHSFTVYPDGLGGVIVLTGVWAILRAAQERETGETRLGPWFLHGAALALLPWMHSRFALLAGSLGALIVLRLSVTRNATGKAVAFLVTPAVSAMCWVGFFVVIYGIADPSAPYGSARDFSTAFIPGGLTGLLFDQRFGLLANAPVLVCAIVGFAVMLAGRVPADLAAAKPALASRRLALELLFVVVPYLLTATSYAMWWAGWSAPARFANPAVLTLAIPCAIAAASVRDRATRTIAAGALALTAFLSFVLVSTDGGRLAYNTRETTALWLEWASRLTALGDGVPAWFRGREGVFARDVAIWAVFGALAWALAWAMSRALAARPSLQDRARFGTAVAAIHAAAVMVALTIVWTLHGVDGVKAAPAQLELLRGLALEPRALALQIDRPQWLDRERLVTMLRLESEPRPVVTGPGGPRNDQPLMVLPAMPAGRYRIHARTRGPGGWTMVGIAQDQFALRTEPLAWPPVPMEIDFPVDVRALIVRGDEDARRSVRSVTVEPVSLVAGASRLTDLVARRAVKYDGAAAFFLDERSFPEPEAFWVGGRRQSQVVIQADRPASSVTLLLRNAPVANDVTLESGRWREVLTLAPGEERQLAVPLAADQRAALVTFTSSAGFRPSEADPASRDARVLGVWVKIAP